MRLRGILKWKGGWKGGWVADLVFQEGICAVGGLPLADMTVFGGLNGELAL